MPCYQKVQEVQLVQEVQGGQQWSKLSHILRMTKQDLEVPVAQEDRLVLVCHSLGYLENLAPQGGPADQELTLL